MDTIKHFWVPASNHLKVWYCVANKTFPRKSKSSYSPIYVVWVQITVSNFTSIAQDTFIAQQFIDCNAVD